LPTVTVAELAEALGQGDRQILDVRGQTEYDEVQLPGATHIPLGFLPKNLDKIAQDRPALVHCASGYRSQVATWSMGCIATLAAPASTATSGSSWAWSPSSG
jgi:hydroxyacylglutathione hydrolase